MKIDLNTSWGYPVMRPTIDDYVESEFQSSLELLASSDFKQIELNYQIALSVPELKKLISEGKARVVVYVFCRDTWFTKQIDASDWNGVHSFDAEKINGETHIWTLIVANGETKSFTSKKFHPEYGDFSFDISDNQILAIAEPESRYISREVFNNAASLFDYDINHNLSEGEWRLILDENRLVIQANEHQIRYLRNGENTTKGKAALLNGIFLPALTVAVSSLLNNRSTFEDLAWAKIIEAKISILKEKSDPLIIAQKLLHSPLVWLNKHMNWIDDAA